MDYGRLASLYRKYLGRDPEPGAEGWLQYDDETIENGIANSEEANNYRNQSQQQPQQQQPQAPSGLDDNAIRQLYQQYLGRDADSTGLNTFRGQSYEQVLQGILGSGEYAQRITNQQAPTAPTTPAAPADTASQFGITFDINNPQNGAVKTDRSQGMYKFTYANGSTATYYDAGLPFAQQIAEVTPAFSTYEDPANKRLGYRNYAYAGSSAPDEIIINGQAIPVKKEELLLNSQGKVFTDPDKGNRTYTILDVTPKQKDTQTFQVFDSVIKIGAAVAASAAMGPGVGASILTSMGASAATAAAYGAAVTAAVAAGGSTALNGALNGTDWRKVVEESLKNSAIAGVTAGIAGEISSAIPKDVPATVAGGATGAVKGTVTALLGGKDPISGLARGTISGLTSGAIKDIQTDGYDLQGDDQVFDTEEQRYLTPYEVSVKYPELYPEGIPVEERTPGERLAGTTATTLAGALSSYFFPSTKPSTGGTRTSGREPTPSSTTRTVPRETAQTTARSPTAPMMSTSSASPATSSYFGPSTSALGQALNIGNAALASGGGGDQGSTGEDISEESGAAPKKKWVNAQSLRDLDEIGS